MLIKKKFFLKFQKYLLSDEMQSKITSLGRRRTTCDVDITLMDKNIFNHEWGIDLQKKLIQIIYSQHEVIFKALELYQTTFRKPSLTVYCLDFSGSMDGTAIQQLRRSMEIPERESEYIIQPSNEDII